jgi:hypothetical protein
MSRCACTNPCGVRAIHCWGIAGGRKFARAINQCSARAGRPVGEGSLRGDHPADKPSRLNRHTAASEVDTMSGDTLVGTA